MVLCVSLWYNLDEVITKEEVLKKLKILYQLSPRRKFLLLLAFGLSFYSFLLMLFFKKYATFGERKAQIAPDNVPNPIVMDIRYVIFVVSKYVPWQNVCRHQAYQAKILFSMYDIPYQIFVGFKKNEDGKIDGHAWTMAGGLMVTGFCNPDEYVVQSVFS